MSSCDDAVTPPTDRPIRQPFEPWQPNVMRVEQMVKSLWPTMQGIHKLAVSYLVLINNEGCTAADLHRCAPLQRQSHKTVHSQGQSFISSVSPKQDICIYIYKKHYYLDAKTARLCGVPPPPEGARPHSQANRRLSSSLEGERNYDSARAAYLDRKTRRAQRAQQLGLPSTTGQTLLVDNRNQTSPIIAAAAAAQIPQGTRDPSLAELISCDLDMEQFLLGSAAPAPASSSPSSSSAANLDLQSLAKTLTDLSLSATDPNPPAYSDLFNFMSDFSMPRLVHTQRADDWKFKVGTAPTAEIDHEPLFDQEFELPTLEEQDLSLLPDTLQSQYVYPSTELSAPTDQVQLSIMNPVTPSTDQITHKKTKQKERIRRPSIGKSTSTPSKITLDINTKNNIKMESTKSKFCFRKANMSAKTVLRNMTDEEQLKKLLEMI